MVFSVFVTVTGGLFAMLGAGALFVAVVSGRRAAALRLASYAFGAAGLVLVGGNIFGVAGEDAFLPGLMMLLFGTSMTAVKPKQAAKA